MICDETTLVEFGNQQECHGCLKICKYNDKNGDGEKDPREPRLKDWEFTITDSQGNSWSLTTNRYGTASKELAPGDYNVTETLQDGWTNTEPKDGSGQKTVTINGGKTTIVYFGNQQQAAANSELSDSGNTSSAYIDAAVITSKREEELPK